MAPESSYCERYFRSYLEYELASPDVKAERLFKKKERLASEIAAIYAKISRFRKQYRAVMKKLRDLGSRENRNILKFEIDEMLSDGQLPAPEALNFFLSRPSSFTVSVRGKRFINPFLRLLNSFDRSAEVP